MKTIHILKKWGVALASLLLFAACEKDGDKVYVSPIGDVDYIVTTTQIVLTPETANYVALGVSWTPSALVASDPNVGIPSGLLSTYIQLSTTEDFSSNVVEVAGTNQSKTFTGFDLNVIAGNLGLDPDMAATVYLRLRSSLGSNIESVYSVVKRLTITPFEIVMDSGYILDSEHNPSGVTLYSPTENGIYAGFMGASSWAGFYMQEADGTVWGNVGAAGNTFKITTASDQWNMWFPGVGGCYYATVNTVEKYWTALYVPSLTVTGGIAGELTYDRPNNKWYLVFSATAAGNATIQISTNSAEEYNKDGATPDAAPAITGVTVAFAQQGDNVVMASAAGNITVNVPATGDCTLLLDLSDPKAWTCEVVSGSEEPENIPQQVYLLGIQADWNFNTTLPLYDEDNLKYAGVASTSSEWGYQIGIENDNWGDIYTMASGDAASGTLEFQGSDNITAPADGLYLFDVSLKDLTYALSAVGSTIYISGLDDIWSPFVPLASVSTGVYSADITIAGASPWGFKVHLYDEDWGHYFGGGDGKLSYLGANITDDSTLSAGTYTFTVDLINATITIVAK